MLYLLHTHWLIFFGALVSGLLVGWLTYLRPATRWNDRPIHVVVGTVAIGVVMAIATARLVRHGFILSLGLGGADALFYAGGCFIGWALRDLTEFMPAAAHPVTTASVAMNGSYIFRDAFAGMGARSAYLRTPPTGGGVARERAVIGTRAHSQAPAPGGYTFPQTLPFANATTSRRAEPATGLRPHWSWPREAGPQAKPPL